MSRLPFKITAQTVGAQKAYRAFVREYGLEEGRRIFLQKANERGEGSTLRKRVNSVYKTGAKLRKEVNMNKLLTILLVFVSLVLALSFSTSVATASANTDGTVIITQGPSPNPIEEGGGGGPSDFCSAALNGATRSLYGSTWRCHFEVHAPTYAWYSQSNGWVNGENPCWHYHYLHTP